MKRLCTILLAIITSLPLLNAQEDPQFDNIRQHTVKLSLTSPLIVQSLALGYEYDLNHRFGVAVDLGTNFSDPEDDIAHGIFAQAQIRYYIAKLRNWGCAMPFVATGVNYAYAWRTFDFFVSNDGWDINTRPYVYHDGRLCPELMFGLRVNIPCGLTIESTIGGIFGGSADNYSPSESLGFANHFTTNWTTRIGWSF